MDSAVVVVVDPSVGEKRSAENDCDDERLHNNNNKKKKKKARFDDGSGDLKKVAEIVLVLSALGKMRSGRCPTLGEKKLMAEAREKLAEMCQGIAPKDILPRDAGRVLIEDLGLNNKSRDQKLGFLPPKMSISDKLLLTKKKMEDSKRLAAQSGAYSSQLPKVGVAVKPEIHGTLLQASPRTVPNVPRHITVPVGGVQPASPMVHVFALASPTSNKLPGNEMRPAMVSKGLPSSSLPRGSSSLPLVQEAAHSKINGMAHASQIRAKSSVGNLLEKAPAFSSQLQAGIAARVGASEKVSNHNNVEGTLKTSSSQAALQIARDQNSKPSVIHTAYGNLQSVHQPSQGTNLVNVSKLSDNHKDAARNVQKFLQQKLPVNPSWTPPSTDYMNKSLACQICKVAINNIESLLVCDGCEKGVHLKCLQSYYQKPIPKGEWHCPQCLISNCGKPLPSKYGRVAKNIIAQKVFPTSSEVHTSSEVKAKKPELKVIPQKITANGPSPMNPSHAGITGSKPASDLNVSAVQQMPADKFSASRMDMDDGLASDRKLVLKEVTGVVYVPHSGKPNESSSNNHIQNSPLSPCNFKKSTSDPNILPKLEPGSACPESLSDTAIDTCPSPLALCISQDVDSEGVPKCAEVSSNQCQEIKISDFRETSECYSDSYVRQADQNVAEKISTENLDIGNTTRDCTPLDGLHSVDWVGDILQVVDEKAFYQSCCINGVVYKLQDHALFHSNNDNVRPSKLKALWENTKTKLKWAIVNRCYMPDDLPEVVGRPCTPENNEVYESNHDSTVRAGLIQGPCEVLSPNRFKEESERRVSLAQEPNNGLQPVFLCKWFYDESKGLFQPISD